MSKKWLIYAAIFAAGVIAGPKVRSMVPGANKLPTL